MRSINSGYPILLSSDESAMILMMSVCRFLKPSALAASAARETTGLTKPCSGVI
jgi:hypothetical protein